MTIIRWIVLIILSLLIAGCGILAEFRHTDPQTLAEPKPPTLHFLRGDIAFPMDTGSYCWTTGEMGICADMIPPIYTADMHVLVIGNTLELLFEEPFPESLTVSLHPGSNVMTRVADIMAEAELDENGRVLVTVPENVDGDYVLMVFATWSVEGDAFYTTPVRFDR